MKYQMRVYNKDGSSYPFHKLFNSSEEAVSFLHSHFEPLSCTDRIYCNSSLIWDRTINSWQIDIIKNQNVFNNIIPNRFYRTYVEEGELKCQNLNPISDIYLNLEKK